MSLPDYKKFKQYCESNGVQLLTDDIAYIDRVLKRYSAEESRKILLDYVQEWLSGINEEQSDVQKQNKGRHRANQWLTDWTQQHRAVNVQRDKSVANAHYEAAKSAQRVTKTPTSERVKTMSAKAFAAREECLALVGLKSAH